MLESKNQGGGYCHKLSPSQWPLVTSLVYSILKRTRTQSTISIWIIIDSSIIYSHTHSHLHGLISTEKWTDSHWNLFKLKWATEHLLFYVFIKKKYENKVITVSKESNSFIKIDTITRQHEPLRQHNLCEANKLQLHAEHFWCDDNMTLIRNENKTCKHCTERKLTTVQNSTVLICHAYKHSVQRHRLTKE